MNIRITLLVLIATVSSAAAQTSHSHEATEVPTAPEPTIEATVGAALALSSIDPAVCTSALRRARRRGLLPEVRFGIRRGFGRDYSIYQSDESERIDDSSDDELAFDIAIVFRLDRLAYATEEVALLRERERAAAHREEIVRGVTSLYFERRRLQRLRELRGSLDLDEATRLEEVRALLEIMTGLDFG